MPIGNDNKIGPAPGGLPYSWNPVASVDAINRLRQEGLTAPTPPDLNYGQHNRNDQNAAQQGNPPAQGNDR